MNFQPMIQVASKYERRVDTRSYGDKKKLFEGVSFPFGIEYLTIIIIQIIHNLNQFKTPKNAPI